MGGLPELDVRSGHYVIFKKKKWILKKIFFHAPGEHKIRETDFDAEIQFLHQDDMGNVLVVAVFVHAGQRNPEFSKLLAHWSNKVVAEKSISDIDLTAFLPRRRQFYLYGGSKTVPPCNEGISWLLLEQTISLSSSQIDKWLDLFMISNRPLQPIGARDVMWK